MNTQDMISIKAKHQNEIRRFALPLKSTYATLESSLNDLFTLSSPVIKYTDDEGDLCTISTQQELDYAVSSNKGLLRLTLFSPEELKAQVSPSGIQPVVTSFPSQQTGSERNPKHFLLEKMDNKHAQLVSKRDDINGKLQSDALNSERRRVLSWKLDKIQEKIAGLEARRQQMALHLQNPEENPWRGGPHHRGHLGRGGWGGGRGGRHGHFGGHHGPPGAPWEHGPHHHEHGPHHGPPHHEFGQPGPHHGPPHHEFGHPHHEHPHHGPPHEFGPPHHGHPHHEFPEHCSPQQKEQRWLDWMDKRQANLASKRDSLNSKIADESNTPQRKEILTAKLNKVQEKLTALESRRQQLASGEGGCGRGGRRGHRGGWGKHCAEQSDPKNEETK